MLRTCIPRLPGTSTTALSTTVAISSPTTATSCTVATSSATAGPPGQCSGNAQQLQAAAHASCGLPCPVLGAPAAIAKRALEHEDR